MAHDLVLLSAGGTFEKVYLSQTGTLGFDRSRLPDWAQSCRLAQPWRADTLMLIDSLEMTDAHRRQIADQIASLEATRVVLVHGTDTMTETAKAIMLRRKEDQVIVLTGAMVPASAAGSDALFNLGMAVAATQTLDAGVYIAMSGQIWPADQVKKNREKGVFETALPDETNGTVKITKRKQTGWFR